MRGTEVGMTVKGGDEGRIVTVMGSGSDGRRSAGRTFGEVEGSGPCRDGKGK